MLWAHNDSGGAAELYAFAEDGTASARTRSRAPTAVDWEDMAAGPAPNGSDAVLYIGDIGDNDAARPTVTVYRVHEPGEAPGAAGGPARPRSRPSSSSTPTDRPTPRRSWSTPAPATW